MHAIFYYILLYLVISAIGMHAANKKVTITVRKQRWLKFFMYMLITATVIASILFGKLLWMALIIVIAATYELLNANFRLAEKKYPHFAYVFILFMVIAYGFINFSIRFSPAFQLFIFFQVFTFDAFCQITGQLFGKHVISARVSPAKTAEGLIGGVVFCILSALLGSSWVHLSLVTASLPGACTALTSFCGDMLASYFKRLLKIKDYSNLLPGQGGFLDRFDSLMMTGAVYYFLLQHIFGTG